MRTLKRILVVAGLLTAALVLGMASAGNPVLALAGLVLWTMLCNDVRRQWEMTER